MTHTPRATIDFESRSQVDLKKTGSWRYSLDPSTQPVCLAWRLPYWAPGRTALWHPEFPDSGIDEDADWDELLELMEWIRAGKLVEAHNAWFERGMWTNIMGPRYGWALIDAAQWRCSAAKAAALALPRGLGQLGEALHLGALKDAEGHKLMLKMCKPRKPRKAEREAWAKLHGDAPHPVVYWETRELLEREWDYCRQDVLAEEAVSDAIPDLSPEETVVYLLDQTINERGFLIDQHAVDAALDLIAQETTVLTQELAVLTGGRVKKATQRAQMMTWFESVGLRLPDTQKETIDDYLARANQLKLSSEARRGLQIVRTLGRSSTAKYGAMRNQASPLDGRVRGGLLYHGATTGRWSGAGVQPHNFPKGTLDFKQLGLDKAQEADLTALWDTILTRDRATLGRRYGNVMEALSHGLRGAIHVAPGRELFVADYASIEARVVLWLAGDESHLDIFRKNGDVYLVMASRIYGYPCTKNDHPKERALGKVAVLGLGYQMGASKFVDSAAKAGIVITEAFSQEVVDAYRSEFWLVKQAWYDQEEAAIRAAEGETVTCGPVEWFLQEEFLYCELPSGRRLCYPYPEVRMRKTPWGDMKEALTFMGVDGHTHQWTRQTTYGGKLVENLVQAISRDIMSEALVRAENSNLYEPILSVHDELLAEAPLGRGNVKEFEALMSQVPTWAPGCPVAAEGWAGLRYHK